MKVPKHSTGQGFESSSTGSKTTFRNSTQAYKQLYLGISAVELMQPVHESSFSLSVSFNGTDEQHLIFSGVLETEQQNSLVTNLQATDQKCRRLHFRISGGWIAVFWLLEAVRTLNIHIFKHHRLPDYTHVCGIWMYSYFV